ncbi:cell filamentation protein fic [mine drainage metagenome]|uniref:Cell filamentation protein fic n=1 Tax=mine drainage metagenome TaxID=410659 RepID=T1C7X5_9ZZZZ
MTPPRQPDRYVAQGIEAEFEPGSRGRVLRNLAGVRSVREMTRLESEHLLIATERLIDETTVEQRFHAEDVRHMHRLWLGDIYAWAGEYRQVNMTKGSFMFAASNLIPRLMQAFEQGPLREFTPCKYANAEDQAQALAVVHAELILIHPFRDGNGRCARLLAVLMGLQAGLPALDFGGVRGEEKRRYIAAVHAAMDRKYEQMIAVFSRIIARTQRVARTSRG